MPHYFCSVVSNIFLPFAMYYSHSIEFYYILNKIRVQRSDLCLVKFMALCLGLCLNFLTVRGVKNTRKHEKSTNQGSLGTQRDQSENKRFRMWLPLVLFIYVRVVWLVLLVELLTVIVGADSHSSQFWSPYFYTQSPCPALIQEAVPSLSAI